MKINKKTKLIIFSILIIVLILPIIGGIFESLKEGKKDISTISKNSKEKLKKVLTNPLELVNVIKDITKDVKKTTDILKIKGKPAIDCSVSVDADVLSQPDLLDDAQCVKRGSNCVGLEKSSQKLLSFFGEDVGSVVFYNNGNSINSGDFVSERAPFFGEKDKVHTTLCSDKTEGTIFISLLNDRGEIVDMAETIITQ